VWSPRWGATTASEILQRWRDISAPALFVTSFALLIGGGTIGLLALPRLQAGPPLGFVDALFTMTSAVCVTGLIVVDTATHFTSLGQLWILGFIQLGGLGLITITTLIIGALGRGLSLQSETVAVPGAATAHGSDVVSLVGKVIVYTLAIEAAGAWLLWLAWLPTFDPDEAAWHAVFHTVSAFCNAGFSTFGDSLVGFAERPAVLLPISALIVLGGFGYLGSAEVARWARGRGNAQRPRLSAHTYATLTVTLILLAAGFVAFAFSEWRGVLGPLPLAHKLVNAWFMSVTPRTAGFNSIPYDAVGNGTAYLTLFLMLVGGSPGSMAGGVKTTALAVLTVLAVARVRGVRYVELNGRAVPEGTVQRIVSLVVVAVALVSTAVLVLTFTETQGLPTEEARRSFLPILFEGVSAFGTVGLSMGITPTLSTPGKLVVIVLMFLGRVGPLSFFAAVALRNARHPATFRPAHEDVIVG
jgi:trk system potassium uptake protein TrkH